MASQRATCGVNTVHLLSRQGQQLKHEEAFTPFSQDTDEIQERFLQDYFIDVMSALKLFNFLENRALKMCTVPTFCSVKTMLNIKSLKRAVRRPKRLIKFANSCKSAYRFEGKSLNMESIRIQSLFPRKRQIKFFLEKILRFPVT